MNIAPRVIATISTVVKIEARTIFMGLARRTETAEERIAQLGEKQNAQTGGNGGWEQPGKLFEASSKHAEAQRKCSA
jgi:hypothetical protein